MAKWRVKSKGLDAVIEKQEKFQDHFVKNNQTALVNASSALLKWSMTESNLSLFDVFSAWSDLDYALAQLSKAVLSQLFAFKQMCENIKGEEKSLGKLRADAEIASKRVRQAVSKLESAKKAKKKDKDQVKIDNCDSELTLALGAETEIQSIVAAKKKEFELNKAKWVKDILILLSRAYVEHLEQSLDVWKEKLSIAEAMADEPVYHAEQLNTESAPKVSALFHKLSMDLPQREAPPEDTKSRTPSKQPPPIPEKGGMTTPKSYLTIVSSGGSYGDEDKDYVTPDDPPQDDHLQDSLVVASKNDVEESSPPRSPPTIPSSPASSMNDDTLSNSSSSNVPAARADFAGEERFKVLSTLPSPKLRHDLEQTQGLPLDRETPANPPPAVDPPPVDDHSSPPSPRPGLSMPQSTQELYSNEPAVKPPDRTTTPPSEHLSWLPGEPATQLNEPPPKLPEKPVMIKRPAILSKPAKPPKPPKHGLPNNGESPNSNPDIRLRIKAVDDEFNKRWGASDFIGAAELFTEDLTFLPPGAPAVHDRAVLARSFEYLYNVVGVKSVTFDHDYISPQNGNRCYSYGIYHEHGADGTEIVSGHFTVIWDLTGATPLRHLNIFNQRFL